MAVLEKYEWSDLWCENANESGARILLMGDSITRGYYDFVKENFAGAYNVDKLATSTATDNPALVMQLDCFLQQFDYALIHLSNGLHGEHIRIDDYTAGMEQLILHIRRTAPRTKLVLALLTPVMQEGTLDVPAAFNRTVEQRNAALRALAKKYALPLDDLYAVAQNKPEIRLTDGFHYEPEGYRLLAGVVTKQLRQALEV